MRPVLDKDLRRLTVAIAIAVAVCASSQQPAAAQVAVPVAEPADTMVDAGPDRSPGGAFLRSLVIPGWGQAWVGAPGRGGVYFAIESASLWMVYKTASQLSEARAEQEFLRESGVLEPDDETGLVRSREAQLEDWITFSAFMLFFSGADAYVAAYLADFSEHVGVTPGPAGELRLQATIPIGRR
ncbi:MAG TPA: hypothetical protein VFI91_01895 [Longimicrobiaceae bacterium]|nr:hypothetical protein [Longimicrobiaceae bacterium]